MGRHNDQATLIMNNRYFIEMFNFYLKLYFKKNISFNIKMRIIESGYELYSVAVEPSLPSVNEPHETDIILDFVKNNVEQKTILEKIMSN